MGAQSKIKHFKKCEISSFRATSKLDDLAEKQCGMVWFKTPHPITRRGRGIELLPMKLPSLSGMTDNDIAGKEYPSIRYF
jgi:hypothetical protein